MVLVQRDSQDGNLFCGNPKLEEKGSGMTRRATRHLVRGGLGGNISREARKIFWPPP